MTTAALSVRVRKSEDDGLEADGPGFDEDEFTAMMSEMMEMPPGVMSEMMGKAKELKSIGHRKDTSPAQKQDDEIIQSMDQIERELRDAGALDLGHGSPATNKKISPARITELNASSTNENNEHTKQEMTADETEGADLQENLARNLMESFKSQGGAAGPGGNLLGLMGMPLPRDEEGE